MLPIIQSLIYLILLNSIISQSQIPTSDDINDLRIALRNEFDATRFRELLTATVRLIFHDCAGPHDTDPSPISICNGCIDFSNEDHAGLTQKAVEPLNQLYYAAWSTKIPSRADFWAAAATIAIEYAAELSLVTFPNDILPEIPFYFGRTDCISSFGNAQNTKHFVSGDFGWNGVKNWFNENLGFTDEEIVTIIGAHTLGRTNSGISGYSSYPWVHSRQGPDQLNNFYYRNLLNVNGNLVNQQSTKGKWEWADNQQQILMMNSDMCMVLDFDNYLNTAGKVTCPGGNTACPENSVTKAIVQQYVAQNQLFLDKFAAVFEKLIKTGYSDHELTVIGSSNNNNNNNNNNNKETTTTRNTRFRNKAVAVSEDNEIIPLDVKDNSHSNETQMLLDEILWVCVVGVMMICGILFVFLYRLRKIRNNFDLKNYNKCSKYECVDNDDNPEELISISKL